MLMPKRSLETSSMNLDLRSRLDGTGNLQGKVVDYSVSELRTIELMEELCKNMKVSTHAETKYMSNRTFVASHSIIAHARAHCERTTRWSRGRAACCHTLPRLATFVT